MARRPQMLLIIAALALGPLLPTACGRPPDADPTVGPTAATALGSPSVPPSPSRGQVTSPAAGPATSPQAGAASPGPTAIATSAQPVPVGTPVSPPPRSAAAIAPDNAGQVVQLARWGNGVPGEVRFSPDGRRFAAASKAGIALYDAATLAEAHFIAAPAEVETVAFAPDGALLAALLRDGTAHLWRAADGAPLHALPGHGTTAPGGTLAFSPDGEILAVAADDGPVRLWRVADGAPLGVLTGHQDPVQSLAFSADGVTLTTADRGRSYHGGRPMTVRVWRLADGAPLRTAEGPHHVSVAALAAGGALLATALNEMGRNEILLWQLDEGGLRHTATLPGPPAPTLPGLSSGAGPATAALAVAPDGAMLAVGSLRGEVHLWHVADRTRLHILRHPSGLTGVTFAPDGATLTSASRDGTARLWRVADAAALRTVEGFGGSVQDVTWAPDGAAVAAGTGADGVVQLWRVGDGAPLRALAGHTGPVNTVVFSPDGALLASAAGALDGTVRLWRAGDGALLRTLPGYNRNPEAALAFAPDGSLLAVASDDRAVRLWRLDGAVVAPLRTLAGPTGRGQPARSVAFSPDGALLAASYGQTARLWRVADGALLRTWATLALKGESSRGSVAFTLDGEELVTLSQDVARLWRVEDGALLQTVPLDARALAMALAPDGAVLAVGIGDGRIQLWALRDGALLHTLRGHTSGIGGLAFSPDGALLVSGSEDGTVRLWGLAR